MTLLADLQKALAGHVEERVDLSGRTSMRVGGVADVLAMPDSERALADAIDACEQHGATWTVLGGGSNTLLSDAGVRGVVFRLSPRLAPEQLEVADGIATLRLGAGQPIAKLVSIAKANDLVGMEFLVGIPGTIGGAVIMNAGTKAGSTERVCVEVGLCEPGRVRALAAAEVGFGYRHTALPPRAVVTWARFRMPVGAAEAVQRSRQAMEEDLAYRRRTQPLNLPNSGSVFRNPPGDAAARLIQACGLKGVREGGAQISEVHANFIVNHGEAKARDILALMRRMQDAVFERFGVLLVPEVKLMGEFDPGELPRGGALPEAPAA